MTDYLLEKFRKRFIMNQRTITWSVLKMPISLILFGVIRKNRYICTISIICQSWELVFDCKHEECYDRRTMAMAGAWNGVEGCLHLSYYADSAVAQCLFSLYRSIVSSKNIGMTKNIGHYFCFVNVIWPSAKTAHAQQSPNSSGPILTVSLHSLSYSHWFMVGGWLILTIVFNKFYKVEIH